MLPLEIENIIYKNHHNLQMLDVQQEMDLKYPKCDICNNRHQAKKYIHKCDKCKIQHCDDCNRAHFGFFQYPRCTHCETVNSIFDLIEKNYPEDEFEDDKEMLRDMMNEELEKITLVEINDLYWSMPHESISQDWPVDRDYIWSDDTRSDLISYYETPEQWRWLLSINEDHADYYDFLQTEHQAFYDPPCRTRLICNYACDRPTSKIDELLGL